VDSCFTAADTARESILPVILDEEKPVFPVEIILPAATGSLSNSSGRMSPSTQRHIRTSTARDLFVRQPTANSLSRRLIATA
jgi:hypothetical protein